ncbi:MAG: hypothetical protein KDA24_16085 [Deltaproteobacteria bacterium]|nr:hypothetical protein [Deltaproteobacteria bacterium]
MSYDLFVREVDAMFIEIGLGEASDMYEGIVVNVETKDEDGLWLKLGSEEAPDIVSVAVQPDSAMLSGDPSAEEIVRGFAFLLRDLAGGHVWDPANDEIIEGELDWDEVLDALSGLALAASEPAVAPEIDSAARFIELLIARGLLEAAFTPELITAMVEALEGGTRAVEDALLKHEHVEELYADYETLKSIVKQW